MSNGFLYCSLPGIFEAGWLAGPEILLSQGCGCLCALLDLVIMWVLGI